MAVITLTTDLGTRDHYVAAIKGVIYSQIPDARIVDVSHDIQPFSTTQAAFVLRNCWRDFPKGSVHIVGVNPDISNDIVHAIVMYEGHYFIGADNGLFSLLFEKKPDEVYELNITQDSDDLTFPTKNLFAKAACHIVRGGTPGVIGRLRDQIKEAQDFRPPVEDNVIKGNVIYVDRYGNVTTNISRALFRDIGKGRDFNIMIKRARFDIRKIHNNYNEVAEGERVALFGSAGFLEIAINKGTVGNGGGASDLFGLQLNDLIRIEFNANQNR
ncbi:MAG: SAM-dependent chlorinase/fluorinase [Flavobacteriales bacterium]|nr:SAM-dependent chlorinase/fluorinase [Flavobacteriales bacterium]